MWLQSHWNCHNDLRKLANNSKKNGSLWPQRGSAPLHSLVKWRLGRNVQGNNSRIPELWSKENERFSLGEKCSDFMGTNERSYEKNWSRRCSSKVTPTQHCPLESVLLTRRSGIMAHGWKPQTYKVTLKTIPRIFRFLKPDLHREKKSL